MASHRVVLALILFVGMSSAAGCTRLRVDASTRLIPNLVFRAITHMPVGLLTIDPTTGTLYGVASGGIIAIDTSGREHQVFATDSHDYICGLAVDGTDHHLLVNFVRYDHPPSLSHFPRATAYAQVIDVSAGGPLNTITIEHKRLTCLPGQPALVAVDPATGHGFVTDMRGQSVEANMGTGVVLHRFYVPPPSEFDDFFLSGGALPWVVDSVRHRLVVFTVPSCQNTCTVPFLLVTINTASGRIVHRTRYSGGIVGTLSLDATTGNVYFRADVLGGGKILTFNDRSGRITASVRVAQLFAGGDVTGNVVADSGNHRVYLYIGGTALKGTGFPGRHNGPAHLFEINGKGTRVLCRAALPNPGHNGYAGAAAVDPITDRLFIQLDLRLLVIDPSTLHVIQSIRLNPFLRGKFTGYMLDTTNHRILAYGTGGIMALNER